jgi:hypothetical protein
VNIHAVDLCSHSMHSGTLLRVFKEQTVSIFIVEMRLEAVCYSETSVSTDQTAQGYNLEGYSTTLQRCQGHVSHATDLFAGWALRTELSVDT